MRENKFFRTMFLGVIAFLATSSISCIKKPLSETVAFSKIQSVPEIQSFLEKINKSGDDAKPIIRHENGGAGNSNLFEYYIGESHSTHDVFWNRFAIDKKTSEIFVFDIESGNYIPLVDWQKRHRD